MDTNDPRDITPDASRERPNRRFLGLLRGVALIAVVVGAGGSVGFMLGAGRNTPRLLLVLFVFWILAPFAALAWVNIVSKRWAIITRTSLYCVTLVITLGSLAIYGDFVAVALSGSANAFRFVATPPASLLVAAIVVSAAAFVSRKRSRQEIGD